MVVCAVQMHQPQEYRTIMQQIFTKQFPRNVQIPQHIAIGVKYFVYARKIQNLLEKGHSMAYM